MNLSCAILHADVQVSSDLQTYIGRVPYLSLKGAYADPLEALNAYYDNPVELYFIGIQPAKEGDIDGMEFCRMLAAPTRAVFMATDHLHASECFRLDALDYLESPVSFSLFLQAVYKATQWFALQEKRKDGLPSPLQPETAPLSVLNVKSDNRILCIPLEEIEYIEGLGDYVKIYCKGASRPVVSLCGMKHIEQRLPEKEFLRIHRSFIVRKGSIHALTTTTIFIKNKELPVGETYRGRIRQYISLLSAV